MSTESSMRQLCPFSAAFEIVITIKLLLSVLGTGRNHLTFNTKQFKRSICILLVILAGTSYGRHTWLMKQAQNETVELPSCSNAISPWRSPRSSITCTTKHSNHGIDSLSSVSDSATEYQCRGRNNSSKCSRADNI